MARWTAGCRYMPTAPCATPCLLCPLPGRPRRPSAGDADPPTRGCCQPARPCSNAANIAPASPAEPPAQPPTPSRHCRLARRPRSAKPRQARHSLHRPRRHRQVHGRRSHGAAAAPVHRQVSNPVASAVPGALPRRLRPRVLDQAGLRRPAMLASPPSRRTAASPASSPATADARRAPGRCSTDHRHRQQPRDEVTSACSSASSRAIRASPSNGGCSRRHPAPPHPQRPRHRRRPVRRGHHRSQRSAETWHRGWLALIGPLPAGYDLAATRRQRASCSPFDDNSSRAAVLRRSR